MKPGDVGYYGSVDRKLKVVANLAVRASLEAGELSRQIKCSECGEDAVTVAHHDDYSKPLGVRWLCGSCHGLHHWALRDPSIKHSTKWDETNLSPLGAAVVEKAALLGMSTYAVNKALGWPCRRIYSVLRAGSVRASWVSDLANLLDLDLRTLIALDARGSER